jgi:hypothetical protein
MDLEGLLYLKFAKIKKLKNIFIRFIEKKYSFFISQVQFVYMCE